MNTNLAPDSGTPITVEEAITLRLPAGSAVFAVHGEAWITQEGSSADVILPAGQRFDLRSRAPLVVSATHDHVDLYLVGPAAARRSASCNVHDFVRAHALELRRAETSHLLDRIALGARSWLQRVRGIAAPRLRVRTQ
jgi:hypothetical protein